MVAIPIAARETSPSGETSSVSTMSIDCISNALMASGHARERVFLM
ncbi:hypothetical protein [Klebsiella michiganensis]